VSLETGSSGIQGKPELSLVVALGERKNNLSDNMRYRREQKQQSKQKKKNIPGGSLGRPGALLWVVSCHGVRWKRVHNGLGCTSHWDKGS
jgi:hypothetical protein